MTIAPSEYLKHSMSILGRVDRHVCRLSDVLNTALDMIGREGNTDQFEVQVGVALHSIHSEYESGIFKHELIYTPAGNAPDDPKYPICDENRAIIERFTPEIVCTAMELLDQLIDHVGYDVPDDEAVFEGRISRFFEAVEEDVKRGKEIDQMFHDRFGVGLSSK